MLGIGAWDWVAVGIYLIGTTAIGFWTVRRVKSTTDFFMAGRRFGKPFMIFFSFGAGTSGNDAVGVSAKTFTNGLSGIWYQWLWLFCTPFYWLIAPVFRRMRALTTGDYFEARYNGSVGTLYAIVGIITLTVNIGVIQLGAGKMIEGITGGGITQTQAILGMTAMFLLYGVAGGLAAAIVTDFIQGILTVILSFILLPYALSAVGGFAGLHESIADTEMFSLVAPGEINLFWVVVLGLNALVGIVTLPHIMGVCAAGRTEMDGRVGFATGNLIKRLCTVAWTVVGLCAVVMYMDQNIDPDMIYGRAAQDLLPDIMPGLIGVFLAALIASVMSSCDAFMVSSSGLFTQNVYRRWMITDKSDNHYVWVGRVASVCIVAGGLAFAFKVPNVREGLIWFFKLQSLMGAAFWLGLFWRRASVAGAWAGTLAGFAVFSFFAIAPPAFHEWAVANLPEAMVWQGKFRDSWQILLQLLAGFGVGIGVSLATRRVPEEKLDRVYGCLRTPVHEDEPHQAEPFMLPEGVEPHPPRKLIDHPDLEIPMPTRVGMTGFAVFWLCVALLIGFVYWMAGWGA